MFLDGSGRAKVLWFGYLLIVIHFTTRKDHY